jgi:hypothetical protein
MRSQCDGNATAALSHSNKGSANLAVVAIAAIASTVLSSGPARAHDWYPKECCHDMDCAPVQRTEIVSTLGGVPQMSVTSKQGTVIVPRNFPLRASKDGRMHVCMRSDEFGAVYLICLFVPPSM